MQNRPTDLSLKRTITNMLHAVIPNDMQLEKMEATANMVFEEIGGEWDAHDERNAPQA